MELLASIKEKLQDAFLSPDELALWDRILPGLSPDQQQRLLDVFSEEQELVRMMTDNIKAKVSALEHQDINSWKATLDHELAMAKVVAPAITK